MKKLYIDCSMGAAGDMLMAGLYELLPEKEEFIKKMNELGIEGVKIHSEKKETCGIMGTHMHVVVNGTEEDEHMHDHHHHDHHHHDHHHDDHDPHHDHHHHDHTHDHDNNHSHTHENEHEKYHEHEHNHEYSHHHHSSLGDIKDMIMAMNLPEQVKKDACNVYELIAKAESTVHGKEMTEVHFHEVGTKDAVADVVGNCLLMNMLGYPQVFTSPVHVGSGTVKCAHGVLPVPAPATALILEGIPVYSSGIKGELCTPTGAALLKYFTKEFSDMPAMTIEKSSYGVGTKEFSQANCVRILMGESHEKAADVIEISANLDDMTGEEIGFAMEILLEEGALDVYCENIIMKKSRPGVKLVCMAKPEDKVKMADLMLKHTTTIGVRIAAFERITMDRVFEEKSTPWGSVTVKTSTKGETVKTKAEFEDLAKAARENGLSLREVKAKLR